MLTMQKEGRKTLEVLVSFDGAVLGVHYLRPGQSLTLGPAATGPLRPDYAVADLQQPLVAASHGALRCVSFPQGAPGEITLPDGSARTLQQLAESGLCELDGGRCRYALPEGARARLQIGGLELRVSDAQLPAEAVGKAKVDWRGQRYTGLSLLGGAAFMGLAFLAPPDPHAMASHDLSRLDNKALQTRFIPAQVEFKLPQEKTKDDKAAGGARAARGPAGHLGDPNQKRRVLTRVTTLEPQNLRSGQDIKALVRNMGALSILGKTKANGLMAQVLDSQSSALGQDARSALAGLLSTAQDPGWGQGGLSLVSTGPGPGGGCVGPACDTIGVRMDRLCTGKNCGDSVGGPGGRPGGLSRMPGHKPEGPTLAMEPPKVTPGLDRETVRRVIRSRMNEFKYCYERQLVRAPDLSGRVVMSFVINKDGRVVVAGAKETTMRSPEVLDCLGKAMGRLSFPQPEGAGLVQVSYPFLFQPAGR
jgi:hypothetical protein